MGDVWASGSRDRSLEIGRTTATLLRLRLLFFPVSVAITFWHWAATGGSRERLLLICAFFTLVAIHILYQFRLRRRGVQTQTMGVAGTVITLTLCALTGGLDSPFIIVLPVTLVTTVMGGPRRDALAAFAVMVAALPLLALIGGTRPVFTSLMILLGGSAATSVGLILRTMYERMLGRIDQTHEDILRMHSEQMQTLTALSAGIARELKAPLSSIERLTSSALEGIGDAAGAAQRLETERGETARMQGLLEEFLNFSRPLSPLSLDTVDGVRIGGEILDLFQGVAQERQLSIALCGEPVALRCDPRKIKQALINLVQNAVEASSAGGEIGIEIESRQEQAAIRVLDRGHGVAEELAARLFHPGVTTKPRGSGLGLTIARSITEQHGGSLTLRRREGGGCAAELIIPRAQAPVVLPA